MVEINEDALKKVYNDIGAKILEVDRKFRDEHAGEDAEPLQPQAREAFAGIGYSMPDSDAATYCRSVADGTPFEFTLH